MIKNVIVCLCLFTWLVPNTLCGAIVPVSCSVLILCILHLNFTYDQRSRIRQNFTVFGKTLVLVELLFSKHIFKYFIKCMCEYPKCNSLVLLNNGFNHNTDIQGRIVSSMVLLSTSPVAHGVQKPR